MAEKTIKTRIQQRFATWAEWQTVWENMVPLKGEVCKFQIPANTNTDNFGIPTSTELRVLTKTGDGRTLLKLLPWDSASETPLSISEDDTETTTLDHGSKFTAITGVGVSKHLVTTSSTEFTLPEETQLSVTGSRTYNKSASFGSTIKVMTDLQVEDHGIEKHYTDFKIPNLPVPAVSGIEFVTMNTPLGNNWGPLTSPLDAVYKIYTDVYSDDNTAEYPDGIENYFMYWYNNGSVDCLVRCWHGNPAFDPDFTHYFRYTGRVTFEGEVLDSWNSTCADDCGDETTVYTQIVTDNAGKILGRFKESATVVGMIKRDEDNILHIHQQHVHDLVNIENSEYKNTVKQLDYGTTFDVVTSISSSGTRLNTYKTPFKLPPAPEIPEVAIACELNPSCRVPEASSLLVTATQVGDNLWKFDTPLSIEAIEVVDTNELGYGGTAFYELGAGACDDHILFYGLEEDRPVLYKVNWDPEDGYSDGIVPDYLEPLYYKGTGTYDGVYCDVWVCNNTDGCIVTFYTQKILQDDYVTSLEPGDVINVVNDLRVDALDKSLLHYTTKSFKLPPGVSRGPTSSANAGPVQLTHGQIINPVTEIEISGNQVCDTKSLYRLPQETTLSVTSNFSSLNPEHGDLITVVTDVTKGSNTTHELSVTKSLLQLPYMDINSIKRKLVEIGDLREVSSSYVSSYTIENGAAVATVDNVEMFDTFYINDSYNTYDVNVTYLEWEGTVSDFRILAENTGTHKVTISRKDGSAITESEILSQAFNELVEHIKNGFSVYFNKLYRIILAQEVDPENISFDTTKIISAE